jgi:hypothetical protein
MLASHQQQLRERTSGLETVLVAQDTTTLNLSNRDIHGVGLVGNGGTGGKDSSPLQGLYVHTGLAMTADGLPLGITSQKIYVRKAETLTKDYKKTVKAKPISEKETVRFVEAVTAARTTLPTKHLVVIGDREADIYEVFQKGQEQGVDLLIRASTNRRLVGEVAKLFEHVSQGEIVAAYETDIPIDHHKMRRATLTIRASSVTLPPPKSRNRKEKWPGIQLTALRVSEEQPEPETEPVQWILFTSVAVTTAEQARETVRWYTYRWRIERFYFTLKTGAFNIEKLQFETLDRFKKAITLYSLVATRILYTIYFEREHPGELATALFSSHEIQLLCLREEAVPEGFTCHQAVVATAKIGGYLARKSDGPPGIKALWIGFQALQYLVQGMLLGERQARKQAHSTQ